MSKRYEPTAEQIALSQERKAKRAKSAIEKAAVEEDKGRILDRKWIQLRSTDGQEYLVRRVRVMTWNVCLFCLSNKYISLKHTLHFSFLRRPSSDAICSLQVTA